MPSLGCASRFPNSQRYGYYQLLPLPLISASFCNQSSQSFNNSWLVHKCSSCKMSGIGLRPPYALPESGQSESVVQRDEDKDGTKHLEKQQLRSMATATAINEEANSTTIISSCLVGLLTGIAVVVFNNAVHEIRDFFWDGIPSRGASWLREEPAQAIRMQVILVPACGGLIVGVLNQLRTAPALLGAQGSSSPSSPIPDISSFPSENVKSVLRPFLKALAACVTLGTGNSLGPEGPSVEIGTSIAKGVELPLYLLLGMLCGFVSLTLSSCTSYMSVIADKLHKSIGIPRALFPVVGGLLVGLMALVYPEILYWGFENVDILLESRPFVKGLSTDLLLQLVGVKIIATSLCRASGLVGGYYAPSLFIGAATGMAYGKFISFVVSQSTSMIHLPLLEVASPQAYGLVGMAATLAGVCQVPLTAVLLLFELTQDYRIVLPLLGAVGLSSWITSGQTRRKDVRETEKLKRSGSPTTQPPGMSSCSTSDQSFFSSAVQEKAFHESNLCEVESSLCVTDPDIEAPKLEKRIQVSEAMRTRYITVLMSTSLKDAVSLMLSEKQSCAMIVNDNSILIGLLTLGGIEEFSKIVKSRSERPKEILVSEMCSLKGEICRVPWTATPGMDLLSAQMIMSKHGMSQVPVVMEHFGDRGGRPVGLLDAECINLTCRALSTRESLS